MPEDDQLQLSADEMDDKLLQNSTPRYRESEPIEDKFIPVTDKLRNILYRCLPIIWSLIIQRAFSFINLVVISHQTNIDSTV